MIIDNNSSKLYFFQFYLYQIGVDYFVSIFISVIYSYNFGCDISLAAGFDCSSTSNLHRIDSRRPSSLLIHSTHLTCNVCNLNISYRSEHELLLYSFHFYRDNRKFQFPQLRCSENRVNFNYFVSVLSGQ